jgi:hypothetical protein
MHNLLQHANTLHLTHTVYLRISYRSYNKQGITLSGWVPVSGDKITQMTFRHGKVKYCYGVYIFQTSTDSTALATFSLHKNRAIQNEYFMKITSTIPYVHT